MPQRFRIASWLSSWFGRHLIACNVSHRDCVPPVVGFNAHSPFVLAYFSDHAMKRHLVASGTPGFLSPRFSHVVPWDAFLCSQAALGRELPWFELDVDATFPASFDLFVKLLRVHPQPLKLLTVVAPARLFELINTVETSSAEEDSPAAEVLRLLGEHVLDQDVLALTDLRNLARAPTNNAGAQTPSVTPPSFSKDGSPLSRAAGASGTNDGRVVFTRQSALRYHVAVLKWCLLQTPWGATRFIFSGEDLRRLIQLKIPLAVAPSQVGGAEVGRSRGLWCQCTAGYSVACSFSPRFPSVGAVFLPPPPLFTFHPSGGPSSAIVKAARGVGRIELFVPAGGASQHPTGAACRLQPLCVCHLGAHVSKP